MKDRIDEYDMSSLNLSPLKEYIMDNGTIKQLKAKEFLLHQNDTDRLVGFVAEGALRHTRCDESGKEHIVGYSFKDGFVAEYSSCLCGRPSLISVQAIKKSIVYVIKYEELEKFWNSSPENQRLGRIVAEQLFVMAYKRLIDSYCATPEERYIDLMKNIPDLKESVPLKEIASFIGVTPETVSVIRKKILKKS